MPFLKELDLLRARVGILGYCVAVILSVLGFGFWQLQVAQSSHYSDLAEKNRIKDLRLVAPRGKIYDRNRKILADNRPSYNVVYIREHTPHKVEETVAILSAGIGVSREELLARINRKRKDPPYQPITLKEDVGVADLAFVMGHSYELPEVSVEYQPRRLYREGELAAHALGYIGEVTEAQLLESPELKSRDQVGKAGLELIYDTMLRGVDGSRRVVVNNSGREIETLPDEVAPIPGHDLFTSIDIDLQKAAEEAFGEKVGAAVVYDPRNGDLLALVSRPAFDPNLFATGISSADYANLKDNLDSPFTNRAIQSVQPPGSIFKVFEAAAGLETDTVTPIDHVFCGGSAYFYGTKLGCWRTAGHGNVDMHGAIVDSCDVYFYNLGKALGIDKISQYATTMGFGRKTGVDLPKELPGLIPSEAYSRRVKKTSWKLIDTIFVSIGQGLIGVTPIQAARAIGGLATGGRLKQPHLVDPAQLRKLGFEVPELKVEEYPIKADTVDIVTKAMWGVVNEGGTGTTARVEGFDVAGKTGTAQVVKMSAYKKGSENEDHAWFLGFAPYRNPEIVVAVLVEHGGHGGEAAAPIAHAVLQAYYKKKTGHFSESTAGKVAGLMSKLP